jgi:hypothetical protein
MKSITIFLLLAVSVAGNVLLALKLRVPSAVQSSVSVAALGQTSNAATKSGAATAVADAKAAAAAATALGARIQGTDWATLSAGGDLATLVARMRAAGFPPLAIHAAVWAELTRRSSEQRLKLMPAQDLMAYWKSPMSAYADPERMAALRNLYRDLQQGMKNLLGPDADRPSAFLAFTERRQFGDLPTSKIDQIKQITQDYSDLTARIRADSQGMLLREDREKLAYLEQEKQKDIAAALTPAEYEDYSLRSSPTAFQLRYQLASFDPTEAEYRAIYAAQSEFDKKYSFSTGLAPRTPDYAEQRRTDEQKLVATVKAAIGDDRGAEYERLRDYSYSSLVNIAQRLDLPKDSALQVWNVQKDVQQRVTAVQANRDLSAADRAQQLSALQQEATSRVTTVLGERGLAAYKASGGYWLQNIVPTQSGGGGGMIIMRGSGG